MTLIGFTARKGSTSHWLALQIANRYLAGLAAFTFILGLAYQLATLTRTLLADLVAKPVPVARTSIEPPQLADYRTLAAAHLFGEPSNDHDEVVATAAVAVLETALPLKLTGILLAQGTVQSQAIITDDQGDESTYMVGDVIAGPASVTLHAVHMDHVVLDRGGRLETLGYDLEADSAATAASQNQPSGRESAAEAFDETVGETNVDTVGQLIARVIQQGAEESFDERVAQANRENATRLARAVAVVPQLRDGQTVGLRVRPGEDGEGFRLLGLKPGDVVTSANGMLLDTPSAAVGIFGTMARSTLANLTIVRSGVESALVIDTRQLEREVTEPE